MDRALTELAEATVGLNTELEWTLSDEITRRQVAAVFKRCATGELTPDQALDVCMDCVNAKLAYTTKVFDGLFSRLADRLTEHYGDMHFPAMLTLQEFFMGLEPTTSEWSTSEELAREELRPVFVRCANGALSPSQALDVFIDNLAAKRDYTMSVIKAMVIELAQQVQAETIRVQNGVGATEDDEPS